MNFKRVIAVVLVVTMTSLCSGCSWVFMDRAPEDYSPSNEPECSGYTMPIVDVSAAAILGLIGALLLALPPPPCKTDPVSEGWDFSCAFDGMGEQGMGFLLLIAAIPSLMSGATGFSWAGDCHKVIKSHEVWLSSLAPDELNEYRTAEKRKRSIERCKRIKRKHDEPYSKKIPEKHYTICRDLMLTETNSADIHGRTGLHRAVMEEDRKNAEDLIFWGAELDAKDKYGCTPLHYAASIGCGYFFEMLLRNGANAKIKDNQGMTPLHNAVEKGHINLDELLQNSTLGKYPRFRVTESELQQLIHKIKNDIEEKKRKNQEKKLKKHHRNDDSEKGNTRFDRINDKQKERSEDFNKLMEAMESDDDQE